MGQEITLSLFYAEQGLTSEAMEQYRVKSPEARETWDRLAPLLTPMEGEALELAAEYGAVSEHPAGGAGHENGCGHEQQGRRRKDRRRRGPGGHPDAGAPKAGDPGGLRRADERKPAFGPGLVPGAWRPGRLCHAPGSFDRER